MLNLLGTGRSNPPKAELQNIRRLLSGPRTFRNDAPEHCFLWSAPETAQFLIDLESVAGEREADDTDERHYLGVLSVSPDIITGELQILDGVQRLALVAMFLAFARDRLPGHSERLSIEKRLFRSSWNGDRVPRVRVNPSDQDWFALYILDMRATLDLPAHAHSPGERRLLACAQFMRRAFAGYSAKRIRRLVRCLTRETAFVLAMSPPRDWRVPALPPPVETRKTLPSPYPSSSSIDRDIPWRPVPANDTAPNPAARQPIQISIH